MARDNCSLWARKTRKAGSERGTVQAATPLCFDVRLARVHRRYQKAHASHQRQWFHSWVVIRGNGVVDSENGHVGYRQVEKPAQPVFLVAKFFATNPGYMFVDAGAEDELVAFANSRGKAGEVGAPGVQHRLPLLAGRGGAFPLESVHF